jgi:type IV fimbrial biogenesis protein FimT
LRSTNARLNLKVIEQKFIERTSIFRLISTTDMQYSDLKPAHQHQKDYPFVWLNVPYVCLNNAIVSPSVVNKAPLVCNKGFTLIELIITLTIAGILLTVAIPSMQSFVFGNRLVSQVNDLIVDINYARSESMKRGVNVVMCKSSNPGADPGSASPPTCSTTSSWESGRIVFVDTDSNNQFSASDIFLRAREPLDGSNTLRPFINDGTPNVSNYIAFTKLGTTTLGTPSAGQAPHYLKLCDRRGASKARAITLGTAGRASIVPGPSFTDSSGNTFTISCP